MPPITEKSVRVCSSIGPKTLNTPLSFRISTLHALVMESTATIVPNRRQAVRESATFWVAVQSEAHKKALAAQATAGTAAQPSAVLQFSCNVLHGRASDRPQEAQLLKLARIAVRTCARAATKVGPKSPAVAATCPSG